MAETTNETTPPSTGKRKLILLLALPLLLLAGVGGTYMAGWLPVGAHAAVEGEELHEEEPPVAPADIVFVDLPNLLLNLNVEGKRLRYLKVAAALELEGEEQKQIVEKMTPRILDSLHLYFRSISPEELAGPEGIYRIKQDLLLRINDTIEPARIRDVLVKEMLVQ